MKSIRKYAVLSLLMVPFFVVGCTTSFNFKSPGSKRTRNSNLSPSANAAVQNPVGRSVDISKIDINAKDLFKLAIEEINRGNYDRADFQLREILQEARWSGSLYYKHARSLRHQIATEPLWTKAHYTVSVEPGESLSAIANKCLGDSFLFVHMAKYNRIRVPGQIEAGRKIKIPNSFQKCTVMPVSIVNASDPAKQEPVSTLHLNSNHENVDHASDAYVSADNVEQLNAERLNAERLNAEAMDDHGEDSGLEVNAVEVNDAVTLAQQAELQNELYQIDKIFKDMDLKDVQENIALLEAFNRVKKLLNLNPQFEQEAAEYQRLLKVATRWCVKKSQFNLGQREVLQANQWISFALKYQPHDVNALNQKKIIDNILRLENGH